MRPFLAVIDPNWASDSGGGGKGANNHYELQDADVIARSYRLGPGWRDTGPGLLFIWATTLAFNGGDAHTLARALGFRVCAGFIWTKTDRLCGACGLDLSDPDLPCCDEPAFRPPPRLGLGRWQTCEHEHLLLARRGEVPMVATAVRPRSIIYAPRGGHSSKPEKAWRQVIEPISASVFPGTRGVEFNARVQRNGWAAVGRLDGENFPVVTRGL